MKAGKDGGESFALTICNVAYFSAFSVGMASIGGFYEQFWPQWGDIFHCFKTCLIELTKLKTKHRSVLISPLWQMTINPLQLVDNQFWVKELNIMPTVRCISKVMHT
jgi:hypothetical protein